MLILRETPYTASRTLSSLLQGYRTNSPIKTVHVKKKTLETRNIDTRNKCLEEPKTITYMYVAWATFTASCKKKIQHIENMRRQDTRLKKNISYSA